MPRRYSYLSRWIGTCLLGFCCIASAQAGEETEAAPTFKLSGFGTLGMTHSSSDQAHFVQDLSQPNGSSAAWTSKVDTKLGVQVNAQISDRVEAVAQLVSRYRYDGGAGPELTWAFARWDVNPQTSLRAGRLGTEFYMLADSRLVGYSYLTVRPPVDYFSILPFTYIDGVDAAYTLPVAGGLLRGKVFAGYTGEKLPFINETWDVSGSPMRGIHFDYQAGPWQARIGYTDLKFSREMPLSPLFAGLNGFGFSQLAHDLSVRDKINRFYSLGLVYDEGPLQAQLMLGYTKRDTASFEDTHNGYLLVGYRLRPVTPFIGYSWAYSAKKPRTTTSVAPLDDAVNGLMDDAHNDQHTVFFGVRWDITPTVAFKAQADLLRGTPDSRFTVRNDTPTWNGRSNVLSLALDFIF